MKKEVINPSEQEYFMQSHELHQESNKFNQQQLNQNYNQGNVFDYQL